MITILISSAGRRVELIRCFRSDAATLGLDLRVIALDSNPEMSSACLVADASFKIARCTTAEFLPELIKICAQENVKLVVPTIDTELLNFAEHQAQFEAVGTRVAVSSSAVVSMARDKAATARFLAEHGLPTPRTELLEQLLAAPASWEWPVILKPLAGSSSMGILRADTLREAELAATKRADYLAQELIDGREFTVNLFFNQAGMLRSAVPHCRQEIRAGEVSKGTTEHQPELMKLALRLGFALRGACGPLCFQAMVPKEGQARIFEINARFGGGFPLAHAAGAKHTQWLLEEAAGLPTTATDQWEEGVTMLRYDAAFYRRANATK